jgi:hypothetical protein
VATVRVHELELRTPPIPATVRIHELELATPSTPVMVRVHELSLSAPAFAESPIYVMTAGGIVPASIWSIVGGVITEATIWRYEGNGAFRQLGVGRPPASSSPSAPTNVVATAGDTTAGATWTAPTSAGSSPITGYVLTASTGQSTALPGTALSGTVTGVTNGTSLSLSVHAINAIGPGAESTSSANVTPTSAPPPPPPPPPGSYITAGATGIAGRGLTLADLTDFALDPRVSVSGYRLTLNQAGTYSRMKWVGYVEPAVSGITLDSCHIAAAGTIYGAYRATPHLVNNQTLRNVTITNTNPGSGGVDVSIGAYGIIDHCDLSGFEDGIRVGHDAQVLYTYVHDLVATSLSHNDGIQLLGGESNTIIKGNLLMGPFHAQTSAIIIKADRGNIVNVTVQDNFLSGGAYTFYAYDASYAGVPYYTYNLHLQNNTFARSSYVYGPMATLATAGNPAGTNVDPATSGGNKFDDGTPTPRYP